MLLLDVRYGAYCQFQFVSSSLSSTNRFCERDEVQLTVSLILNLKTEGIALLFNQPYGER